MIIHYWYIVIPIMVLGVIWTRRPKPLVLPVAEPQQYPFKPEPYTLYELMEED